MVSRHLSYTHRHIYYLSHPPTGKETSLWIVFHGYGQLAYYFLRKFGSLDTEDRMIVAPEGLNRHYLKGFSGRVGANWMTKHEREPDIANTNEYLNTMLTEIRKQLPDIEVVHTLGFSQGAATMSRWICQMDFPLDKVIFWGGAPAYDLDSVLLQRRLAGSRVMAALGEEDPFLSTENFQEQYSRLTEAGIRDLRLFHYPGGHELEATLLKELFLM
ncbi:alpha/beta hydrolase [Cyclobacterium jeungdonense]|uniref:Alpha/beta hydrolase n=1 Tax=Cyclobacterium jeungdonense TaxID=708087 RepID=A0ABT8C5D9_9BACT|nr:alpha/beta hydrolase [Cyclobacterium jeungdonense]MDN3687531.1 alpha/beta hydrolase [Cyclobacterium jeungdonense]